MWCNAWDSPRSSCFHLTQSDSTILEDFAISLTHIPDTQPTALTHIATQQKWEYRN